MSSLKLTARAYKNGPGYTLEIPEDRKPEMHKILERCYEKYNGYASFQLSTPSKAGTNPQNRAFHALLEEFYKSGLHSFNTNMELRSNMMTMRGTQCQEKSSWTEFTSEERGHALDYLISECIQAGLNTKKFDEILRGMGE